MADSTAPAGPEAGGKEGAPSARTVGRPRSVDADRRIAQATLQLLADVGYHGLSMEAVAARARVGKATVYRRYSGKTELVAAVLRQAAGGPEDAYTADPEMDGRSTREALEKVQYDARAAVTNPGALAIVAALLGDDRRHPDLAPVIRRGVFVGRIAAVRTLVEQGVERREVRETVAPDTVAALLFGSLIARSMLGAPLSDAWLAEVMDTIWNGVGLR